MKLMFKGEGTFLLPPNQLCTFEHDGKKIHCNVDLLIEDYKEKQAERINVSEIYKPESKVDSEYAMKTDISCPVIIVRFDDGTYEVLDGNDRLYRAVHEGHGQIMAHILNESELKKYIMS